MTTKKEIIFNSLKAIEEYNDISQLIKRTIYLRNGDIIISIHIFKYDNKNNLIKTTYYQPNGKTID